TYITRPASKETEEYFSISVEKFKEMDSKGEFILRWRSYDIYYGVKKDILDDLNQGNIVIVNVSRQIIDDTRKRFPGARIIFVWVPIDLIVKRIKERGRENEDQIAKRIKRAEQNQVLPGADFIIKNTGTIEDAGNALIDYLISTRKQ
ncbi:MAG: hypothetical protein ACTSRA_18950, partial [Promethearchaeota archaeon]